MQKIFDARVFIKYMLFSNILTKCKNMHRSLSASASGQTAELTGQHSNQQPPDTGRGFVSLHNLCTSANTGLQVLASEWDAPFCIPSLFISAGTKPEFLLLAVFILEEQVKVKVHLLSLSLG